MAHECPECVFVANREGIFLCWKRKVKAERQPKLLGCFTMPDWSGHSEFYLFRCLACGAGSVDYPHGYANDGTRDGLLYLSCQNCGSTRPLYKKETYEALGAPAPPDFWGVIRQIRAMRKRVGDLEV